MTALKTLFTEHLGISYCWSTYCEWAAGGREAISLRRAGYLGERIHVAPSAEEKCHTVGVDPLSSCMQGSQALLRHTGGEWSLGKLKPSS